MKSLSIQFLLASVLLGANIIQAEDDRRPFYVIAHMINSIRQITHYLDRGANALESDIQFHPDGRVKEIHHGFPCDCFRTCSYRVGLPEYLERVRRLTDPRRPKGYHDRMLLQMLDLKLDAVENRTRAGADIARHILDHLWTDGTRKQEVRVVVYINDHKYKNTILGFLEEFRKRDALHRLKDVGFDGGAGDVVDIMRMFEQLPQKVNAWIGDGQTNCISFMASDQRLRHSSAIQHTRKSPFSKVYHWTIDLKLRMRLSLNIGVDAMITNDPDDLVEVLQEEYYVSDYRLATVEDDPFALH